MSEIDDLVRTQNLLFSEWRERSRLLSIDEAYLRYVVGGRPSKLSRVLRALWRVKDA